MIIDLAKENEYPALCALFNAARRGNDHFPGGGFDLAAFLAVIEGEQLLVARVGDEPAGFASVWVQDTFLHHLYVSPRFQRQGIGGRLLQECIRRFGLPMSLKCIAANVEACRFYERQGWRPSATAEGPEGIYILYVCDEHDGR